ncbi:MAG: sigma-70 family RNA polymerase sigma factor, partial [Actinomycetota bacterium]
MSSRPVLDDDLEFVAALRAGDEAAFLSIVEQLQPSMLRVARMYVSTRAVAEEVVQEAWVGVLKGLDGFEGRSSLRTWIFRILVNIAKTRGQRESRTIPFASLWSPGDDEPSVDPERFQQQDANAPGTWAEPPVSWVPRSSSCPATPWPELPTLSRPCRRTSV